MTPTPWLYISVWSGVEDQTVIRTVVVRAEHHDSAISKGWMRVDKSIGTIVVDDAVPFSTGADNDRS